jgi:hypothetical protein
MSALCLSKKYPAEKYFRFYEIVCRRMGKLGTQKGTGGKKSF